MNTRFSCMRFGGIYENMLSYAVIEIAGARLKVIMADDENKGPQVDGVWIMWKAFTLARISYIMDVKLKKGAAIQSTHFMYFATGRRRQKGICITCIMSTSANKQHRDSESKPEMFHNSKVWIKVADQFCKYAQTIPEICFQSRNNDSLSRANWNGFLFVPSIKRRNSKAFSIYFFPSRYRRGNVLGTLTFLKRDIFFFKSIFSCHFAC